MRMLNHLIAKTGLSMTASLRFEVEINVDLNESQTNLTPIPRLLFMITALIATICTGKETTDNVNNRLRKIVDDCDNVVGVVANHCMGGGTGPGLGTPMLELIAMDYRKKSKLDFEVS